jgi:hypothetical protein
MNDDIPCCQADAIRRIRQLLVNRVPTGITMLDEIIAEVKEMDLSSEQQIKYTLLEKVKVYNYIPKTAEEAYLKAILELYHKSIT